MNIQKKNGFKFSLILSTSLHILCFSLFYFGIPLPNKELIKEEKLVTFELLPISEINNIKPVITPQKTPKKEKEIDKKPETYKKPAKQNDSSKTKNSKAEKIEENKSRTEPEPEKVPSAPQKPKNKIETSKTKESDVKKNKVTVKTEEKKTKEKPKKSDDNIDSILKSLEKQPQTSDIDLDKLEQILKDDKGTGVSSNYDDDLPISMTEKLLIRQQIEKNWNKPAGYEGSGIVIVIKISLTENGDITNPKFETANCPLGSSAVCKLIEESAVRAVKTTNRIENLPRNRYNAWKDITLSFEL